jgi:Tfp pilus assembly protein PilF
MEYPNDPEANFMIGITLYKEASLNDFIDSFLEITGLENKNKVHMLNRSLNDQYEVFEEMINRFYLAQLNRKNFYEATFNLAMTYQELNNLDSALAYYGKTVQINPSLVKAHLMMAKIYEKMNDKNKALTKYKDVVRVDPGLFEAYPNLGEMYGNMNVVEIVKKELEEEINQNPNNVEANLSLARILYSRGFHGRAANIYRNVLSIHPENKRARRMLAQLEKGI